MRSENGADVGDPTSNIAISARNLAKGMVSSLLVLYIWLWVLHQGNYLFHRCC